MSCGKLVYILIEMNRGFISIRDFRPVFDKNAAERGNAFC